MHCSVVELAAGMVCSVVELAAGMVCSVVWQEEGVRCRVLRQGERCGAAPWSVGTKSRWCMMGCCWNRKQTDTNARPNRKVVTMSWYLGG